MLWLLSEFLVLAGLVLDCPIKGLSVAPDGLGQYLQDDERRVERLQDEVFLEQGSLQSLETSCGRVG